MSQFGREALLSLWPLPPSRLLQEENSLCEEARGVGRHSLFLCMYIERNKKPWSNSFYVYTYLANKPDSDTHNLRGHRGDRDQAAVLSELFPLTPQDRTSLEGREGLFKM